jgi:hypothetical protein
LDIIKENSIKNNNTNKNQKNQDRGGRALFGTPMYAANRVRFNNKQKFRSVLLPKQSCTLTFKQNSDSHLFTGTINRDILILVLILLLLAGDAEIPHSACPSRTGV